MNKVYRRKQVAGNDITCENLSGSAYRKSDELAMVCNADLAASVDKNSNDI